MKVAESSCENEVFNIGSGEYLDNLFVVNKLIDILDLDHSRISFVEDRLGHDFRYAVNFDKTGFKDFTNYRIDILYVRLVKNNSPKIKHLKGIGN